MTLSLAELRKRAEQEKANPVRFSNDNIFQFSKLKVGDEVRVRFVEDGEPNDVFWRKHCTRVLPFNSIRLPDGTIEKIDVRVSIPAFNLKRGDTKDGNLPDDYIFKSEDDPIQARIKSWWDTEDGKVLYSRYARKERYVMQGFIKSEGYEKDKLYRFVINSSLFSKIYAFMDDSEIETIPCDPERGRDFLIKVTSKNVPINGVTREINDYSTSKWSNSEKPLTAEEKAIPRYVLKDFLPVKPNADQLKVMIEMFEASYAEEPYDAAKWLNVFKPDNVFFDANGNILKGDKSTEIATEIPQSTESVVKTVVPEAKPVITEEIVKEAVAQTNNASDAEDVVKSIMSKLGVQG